MPEKPGKPKKSEPPKSETPNVKQRSDGRWEARMQHRGKRLSGYGLTVEQAVADLRRKQRARAVESLLSVRQHLSKESPLSQCWEEVYFPTISHKSDGWKRQNLWAKKKIAHLMPVEIGIIRRRDLQAIINIEREDGRSLNSLKHLKAIMHGLFEAAIDEELITENPAARLKLPTPTIEERQRQPDWMTAKELAECIDRAQGRRSLIPLVLTGLMGLGFEEIRELDDTKVKPGQLGPVGNKNANRVRTLPLHPLVVRMLSSFEFPLLGTSDSSIVQGLKRVRGKKLDRNTLRHTCASGLMGLGCPEIVQERIMGHVSADMYRRYTHASGDQVEKYLTLWIEHVLSLSTCCFGVQSGVNSQSPKEGKG